MGLRLGEFVLATPGWLWVVGAAIPCGWIALHRFVTMARVRRHASALVRAVLIALTAVVLAGVSSTQRTDRLAVVAVMDLSGSVRELARFGTDDRGRAVEPEGAFSSFLRAAAPARGRDDLLGVVTVGGSAFAASVPTRGAALDRPLPVPDPQATDLEAGIRLAAAMLPSDARGRIVVFSDGNQTRGDALAAAERLARGPSGVPIDVVPVRYRVEREVAIEAVDVPPRAADGATVAARVVLRSTHAVTGQLTLLLEGRPVDASPGEAGLSRRVRVGPGVQVVSVPIELPARRVHRFEAVFEPEAGASGEVADTSSANNRASGFTITPGRGSVLIVDGVGAEGAVLATTLEEAGLDVTRTTPGAMPGDLLGLEAFDLVILQNAPAEEIGQRGQQALAAYVRELGGGLVMVGGPDSFAAGGWRGTPVEPILPVRLDLPERAVTPEAAIVFVLDSSGSMKASVMGSTRTQQEVANESAASAVGVLDERDLVGVIAFESVPEVIVPLGPNRDREASRTAIRRIRSGGGTNLPPALRLAGAQLSGVDAKAKHVIVLSDGRSQDEESLPELAAELAAQGVRVTSIAVGDDADVEGLRALAGAGRGTFYNVTNPEVLPRVFLRAVRLVRSPQVREGEFEPVVLASGSPLTLGLGAPPPLHGLVLTRDRDEPTVVRAMRTPQGEPVLAHWPVELGQVAAFTSDAHRWARDWLGWPGYRVFWTQLVRTLSRAPGGSGSIVTAQAVEGGVRVRLDALDDQARPIDGLLVPVTVYTPEGTPIEVTLTQTGPGVYEGMAAAPAEGADGVWIAVAGPRKSGVRQPPVVGGVVVRSPAENARPASDEALLARIAQATGGRVLELSDPASARLFDRSGLAPREALTPLWPVLVPIALGVFLLDVGTRRVAWDRWLPARPDPRAAAARASDAAAALRRRRGQGIAASVGVGSARTRVEHEAAQEAAEVARAARAHAEAQRLEGVRERMRARVGSEAPSTAAEPSQPAGQAPAEGRGPAQSGDESNDQAGLLAAKRRARERFEQ